MVILASSSAWRGESHEPIWAWTRRKQAPLRSRGLSCKRGYDRCSDPTLERYERLTRLQPGTVAGSARGTCGTAAPAVGVGPTPIAARKTGSVGYRVSVDSGVLYVTLTYSVAGRHIDECIRVEQTSCKRRLYSLVPMHALLPASRQAISSWQPLRLPKVPSPCLCQSEPRRHRPKLDAPEPPRG
jgi:hypothetical protein